MDLSVCIQLHACKQAGEQSPLVDTFELHYM